MLTVSSSTTSVLLVLPVCYTVKKLLNTFPTISGCFLTILLFLYTHPEDNNPVIYGHRVDKHPEIVGYLSSVLFENTDIYPGFNLKNYVRRSPIQLLTQHFLLNYTD